MEPEEEPSSPSQSSALRNSLGYILLGSFGVWLFSQLCMPTEDRSETVSPRNGAKEGNNPGPIKPTVPSQNAPAPVQAYQTDRRKDRTPRWKKIAEWSIAGATGGLLIINILLWLATKNSSETLQKQLELNDRPWVKVTGVDLRGNREIPALSFQELPNALRLQGFPLAPEYQVTVNYEVHLKILGRSPALNIEIRPELYLAQWGVAGGGYRESIAAEEKRACEEFASQKKEIKNAGTAAFPDETPTVFQATGNRVNREGMNWFFDSPTLYVLPVLIGCVDYQFQSSDRHHQTRFVYEIFHAQDPKIRFFKIGQNVSADGLWLVRDEASDYAY